MNKNYNCAFDVFVEELNKKMYIKQDYVNPMEVLVEAEKQWKFMDFEDKVPYHDLFVKYNKIRSTSNILDRPAGAPEQKPADEIKKNLEIMSLNPKEDSSKCRTYSNSNSSECDEKMPTPRRTKTSLFFKRNKPSKDDEDAKILFQEKVKYSRPIIKTSSNSRRSVEDLTTPKKNTISFIVTKQDLENHNDGDGALDLDIMADLGIPVGKKDPAVIDVNAGHLDKYDHKEDVSTSGSPTPPNKPSKKQNMQNRLIKIKNSLSSDLLDN